MTTAAIAADRRHPTLAFAALELQSFLEQTTDLQVTGTSANADVAFSLATNAHLRESCYAVRIADDSRRRTVTLAGHDEAGVLHAVYELLEQGGLFFDITGPILPDRLNLAALPRGETIVTPFVRRRGIRQHINFPMDISSYPLAEALEYIRNLARMRMNHITFHSYNGQWHGYTQDGEYKPGGHFFYGTRFDLPPREPFTRRIRNRSVYCIPEIEAAVDDPERRSRMAADWLNAVIAECRRGGLRVQLSIEPPGKTRAEGLAACRDVLKLYPAIDTLELITPECGNSEKTLSVDEIRTRLVEAFGPSALDDKPLLGSLKDNLGQLEGGLRHCIRNIGIVTDLLAAPGTARPALAVGAYITCPDSLRILHAVMQRHAPEGVSLTFLPAHGARRAVANLKQMGFTRQSLGRSLLYGWIEFDGNMYLQQNSVTGARQLLEFAKALAGSDPVPGVALNHWRTAENRACIAYAARAFLRGPVPPVEFYRDYARVFGLHDADRYARLMQELDDLDDLAREKMFNIGFCANGCWVRPGLRWTLKWDSAALDEARRRYQGVSRDLDLCLASAARPAGRDLVRFLSNRVECTVLQLDCARILKSLAAFCDHDHPERLDAGQKEQVKAACAEALDLAERYLAKHAEAIRDRGCEGTLISYQTTLPNYIAHIRAVFVDGNPACRNFAKKCPHTLPQFDEPPPPVVV